MFKSLSLAEQGKFLASLKHRTQDTEAPGELKDIILKHKSASLPDRPICPHCGSESIVKNGHKGGVQRFKCKECGKTFTYSNNTILFSSKKDLDTWKRYCECFLNKFSLRKCAEITGISLETSFRWRHKILDALQNMQADITLKGVVEADETFFPLSFKGSHTVPRCARKRGHSVKTRGLSHEQVCVPTIVNHEGLSIGKISNLGKPCISDLKKVISNRIERNSIFVTDSLRGYQKVAHDNSLTHIRIPRGKFTNGAFNIQTVNGYHSGLIRLVNGTFKGVATKYLNNYVVYHNFVNFAKNTFSNKLNKLENFVFSTHCNSKATRIKLRPAIPL